MFFYLTEIYDPNSKSWSIKYNPSTNNTYCVGSDSPACPGSGSPCYGGPNQGTAPYLDLYPRMLLMPSGLVFQCGQIADANLLDPSTGTWTHVNTTQYRSYGTLILLPLQNTSPERGKVMVVGGTASDTTAATNPDTTPPTVNITSPANGASVRHGNILVKGTAADNVGGSGVNNVQVQVDSGTFATATPKPHTITAKATDNAGNTGATNSITINVTT